jgi:site-specific DNA-methyltransferase (adenine-specific)
MANISDLKFDHKNARKRTDSSARLIQESLQRYGAARSIVIDEDNRILAGNGTVEGAKALGLTKLKVVEAAGDEIIAVRRSGLSEDDKVGLALADNRAAELSDWDAEMLQQLSEEHDIAPWFEQEDLEALLEQAEQLEPVEGNTDPDEVPEAPEDPITKPGDLWILGNHRLLCGDSTDPVAMERLMEDKPADLWLTDPPYNVALGMNETPEEAKKRNRRTDGKVVKNDSMSDAAFRQFLVDVYTTANCFLRPGGVFYIWHADSEGYNFRGAAHDIGWKVRQCLIWRKSSLVMGRQDYQWMHGPMVLHTIGLQTESRQLLWTLLSQVAMVSIQP